MGPDGSIVVTYEKTSGEKLAEQLFQAANDPNFKPTTDVSCVEVESAGQSSYHSPLFGIYVSFVISIEALAL